MSHDLAAVEATCVEGMWLDGGTVRSVGPVRDVLADYRGQSRWTPGRARSSIARPTSFALRSGPPDGIHTGGPLEIELVLRSDIACRAWIHIGISEGTATPILLVNPGKETMLDAGETRIRCSIESVPLPRGRYYVWVGAYRYTTDGDELVAWQPVMPFDLYGPELSAPPLGIVRLAPVHVGSTWELDAA